MDIVTSGVASPDFKTQAEIAEIIKVPERTLEDWRLNHVGPPYMKLGRHVRYDLLEVVAWARDQRHA
ncbi:helix-turn-helix domain-containing protein [Microbacterium sp. B2969]|uniref:Helix-turn-helix domain-containing protein n=1 Tax=Microbacterium alkaliflavum TaxID=3248839 RepID=A0ABW7Q5W7_9MICO